MLGSEARMSRAPRRHERHRVLPPEIEELGVNSEHGTCRMPAIVRTAAYAFFKSAIFVGPGSVSGQTKECRYHRPVREDCA